MNYLNLTFEDICKQNSIEVISTYAAVARGLLPVCYPMNGKLVGYSIRLKWDIDTNNNLFIVLSDEAKNLDNVKYHELGHIMHPLGQGKFPTLTRELAANSWAIKNYNFDNPGAQSREEFMANMKTAILSYINTGEDISIYTDELYNTAVLLGIQDMIEWNNSNTIK